MDNQSKGYYVIQHAYYYGSTSYSAANQLSMLVIPMDSNVPAYTILKEIKGIISFI
jgi:hypothetical protein